jgi:hypothetical protein
MNTPTAAKYAVETIGLTRSFGSFKALRGIDYRRYDYGCLWSQRCRQDDTNKNTCQCYAAKCG